VIDLLRALAVLAEPPGPEHVALATALGIPPPSAAEHVDLLSFQLYPYASVHLGPEGMLGGVARDRVAGFLHALGNAPPPEPDHLAVLLGAYASLVERERDAPPGGGKDAWARARQALLIEHLVPWVPAFLLRVADLGSPSQRAWADLLDRAMAHETARTPATRTLLSAHLAAAPPLPDPRCDVAADFVEGLLAPVRTGVILTASDLARAAADLGLGRRVGERRFVLRALLQQDASGVLGWLAAAAAQAARRWSGHWLHAAPTGAWWHGRAAGTSTLLAELAEDACAYQSEASGVG
jgi:hypothetical protein